MPDIYDKILSLGKRRGILYPSYEIYGGKTGFFDYGPLGSLLKHNIEEAWRSLYVINEGCMEVATPMITPFEILKASGHVDKFLDIIFICQKCSSSFKAPDILNKEVTLNEAQDAIKKGIACPECNGSLTAEEVHLMFETSIGPTKKQPAFLRPETAQGIFIDFYNLYRFFRQKLPFGIIQVGKGFRNEVSPRQGIIRLREFSMAEAEIFFDPDHTDHPRFPQVKGEQLHLFPAEKKDIKTSLEMAVHNKIIGNQILGYYLAITQKFLISTGIDGQKIRFRQHESTEMAHYANECWDAEIYTQRFGWIECVGIADRSAHDLQSHMNATDADLTAFHRFDHPQKEKKTLIKVKMGELGPRYKDKAGFIKDQLESMSPPKSGNITVIFEGKSLVIDPSCYDIIEEEISIEGRHFIPHVIEPSHGIDRILYCILEHNYQETKKEGETYTLLSLPYKIAPIPLGVFPLINKDGLPKVANEIEQSLRQQGLLAFYDDSGSIGRRYARMDEIGTPFCITIDHQTLTDDTVTIRDRDTTQQERVKKGNIKEYLDKNFFSM
jgi:glycyl-tRNA synthetase